MNKIFILILLILRFVINVPSQTQPTSKLIDTVRDTSCEVLWAQLDNFAVELHNNRGSFATIGISGEIGDLRDDLWTEDMIRRYFVRLREIPLDRWQVVRMRPEAKRKVELWITPESAERPKIDSAEWSLIYPAGIKPFIFAYDPNHAEEIDVCLPSDQTGLLAEVLKANPTARTNVVLKVRSQKEFARRKRQTISELVNHYEINVQQIKIFKQIIHKLDPYRIGPDIEYWLVP